MGAVSIQPSITSDNLIQTKDNQNDPHKH